MPPPRDALRTLGAAIRERRLAAGLTQGELGRRAGIVGKYVSEIERGTRDIPFSTLRAIVQQGLGLRLEIGFASGVPAETLPRQVDEVARSIAGRSTQARGRDRPLDRRAREVATSAA